MKKKKSKPNNFQKQMLLRFVAVGAVFVMVAGVLGMRLFQLQVVEADFWQAEASNQQLANLTLEPVRGMIYDSDMQVLAQSATVWTIEAAPDVLAQSNIEDPARVAARELASILELDETELYDNLKLEDTNYYEVKAKVEKPLADEVQAACEEFNIKGIYLRQDTRRFYPYEELAATILGFTNADGDGIEGLESYYNDTLAGTPGRLLAVRNAWGGEVPTGGEEDIYHAQDGNSIVLTVDADIQQIAERYLAETVAYNEVQERGMVIVMDIDTGAILAMATSPAYNPNDPYEIFDEASRLEVEALPEGEERVALQGEARTLQWRNKALADTYEPGSVLKVITAAAALDSGVFTQESTLHCSGGITVEDREFGCAQDAVHGTQTISDLLINSCNVASVQVTAALGAGTWYDYLNAFGLTEPTGVDLPGEPSEQAISNIMYSEDEMGPVELASTAFGQSNKYTALQMITAVSAAVNGGNLMQPYIVEQVLDAEGNVVEEVEPVLRRQVISQETSAYVAGALEDLVSTTPNGQNAYVAGYEVGGKSGTSQKLEVFTEEGREAYISSFLGFAPASDPEVAVLVALDESTDPHAPVERTWFGTRLAGPYVGSIIEETLPILGVEPQFGVEESATRTTVSTPAVVDLDVTAATGALSQQGLGTLVVGQGATVVSQIPEAYTQVPAGGQVVLYTEQGVAQETIQVPAVLGRSPNAAIEELEALGFNVLTTGAPDNGENVQVQTQEPVSGTMLPKGSLVTLTMQDVTVVGE